MLLLMMMMMNRCLDGEKNKSLYICLTGTLFLLLSLTTDLRTSRSKQSTLSASTEVPNAPEATILDQIDPIDGSKGSRTAYLCILSLVVSSYRHREPLREVFRTAMETLADQVVYNS